MGGKGVKGKIWGCQTFVSLTLKNNLKIEFISLQPECIGRNKKLLMKILWKFFNAVKIKYQVDT